MTWISIAAMSFVIWWLVLFAVLPFGLRTQDDDEDVTLGTVSSAPRGPHMQRAMLWTTVITALVILALYGITRGLGLGIDDIPRIVPDFSNKV
ncbi:MAG: DUF1467 family protein [Rhizobiaceae bacterium]